MLSNKNRPARYNSSKLSPKWIVPFKVIKELTFTQNIELDLSENPDLSNISPIFHTSLIKPYFSNPIRFTGREKTKLGPVIEKENRYKVERVMKFRSQLDPESLHYKVKWKGYDYN